MHAATFQGCATCRVNCFAAAMFLYVENASKKRFLSYLQSHLLPVYLRLSHFRVCKVQRTVF